MNRALVGCPECGFVTRKHSFVGAKRQCPECMGPMRDVSAREARAMIAARQAGASPPHGDPLAEEAARRGGAA